MEFKRPVGDSRENFCGLGRGREELRIGRAWRFSLSRGKNFGQLGAHLVNIAAHAICGLLVWLMLIQLRVRGAIISYRFNEPKNFLRSGLRAGWPAVLQNGADAAFNLQGKSSIVRL